MIALSHLDHRLFHLINQDWSAWWLDRLMPLISHLADPLAVVLWLTIILIMACRWKSLSTRALGNTLVRVGLYLILVYGVNAVVNRSLKQIIHRHRPFVQNTVILRLPATTVAGLNETGSFPSSHSANAFMVATLYAAWFRRRRWFGYSLAVMVAVSRVYLGVHFPADVLAGAGLGFGITRLMLIIPCVFKDLCENRRHYEPNQDRECNQS